MGRGSGTLTARARPRSSKIVKRSFYRAGGVEKATDYGPAHDSYVAADAVKPDGRTGRLEGLFCVDTIADVGSWVNGSIKAGPMYDPVPREIFYHGPEPWVYPVAAWSSIAQYEHLGSDIYRDRYWDLGLPLSEYESRKGDLSGLWRRDGGEILLDPEFVTAHRNISIQRLSSHVSRTDIIQNLCSYLRSTR